MKLLMVTSTFPRWEADSVPPFVLELCQSLQDFEKITVIAPHSAGAKIRETWDGIEIIRYRYAPDSFEKLAYGSGIVENIKKNPLLLLFLPSLFLFQMLAIVRVLRKRQYDVLHAHWMIPQGLCAAIVAKLLNQRLRLVITSHGTDLKLLGKKKFSWVLRWLVSSSSIVTVVSQHQKKLFQTLLSSDLKIEVMPMGIDMRSLHFAQGRYKRIVNRIIYVGRLIEQKGVETLLRAMHRLAIDGRRDLELVIVGEGGQRPALETLSAALNITQRVMFKGWLSKTEIAAELSMASVLVAPSLEAEGLGLVVLEALAAGCAVVASDIDSFNDLLQGGRFGVLFPPGNVDSLSTALSDLFRNQSLLSHLQLSGRHVAESYDWRIVGENYGLMYRGLSSGSFVK